MSGTFGRNDHPTIVDPPPGFSTWRTERGGSDKGGGGLAILYRDTLPAHQWNPPVPEQSKYIMNERQWLLLDNHKERCAFLHVYIACQTTRNDGFIKWNEDLFFLITQEAKKLRKLGFMVLAMGDFNSRVGNIPGLEANTPDTNMNTPLFLNFASEVNMLIINTFPISKGLFTRFMNSSGQPGTKSLLDYGLVDGDHSDTVTSFIIDEHARYACGSDHALLECIIQFSVRPSITWAFHDALQYNITGSTDFSMFQKNLDHLSSDIRLENFSSLPSDLMLPHISETMNQSAMKSFGLKVKHKRKRNNQLPRSIISLIRTKNTMFREYRSAVISSSPGVTEKLLKEYNAMKTIVKESIADVKLARRHKLRSKLLRADPTRKKFWRFLRSQISSAGNISALYNKTGQIVFSQTEIEDAVLHNFGNVFQGKRYPITTPQPTPDQLSTSLAELDHILNQNHPTFQPTKFEEEICSLYTFTELEQLLEKLPAGKASGYDRISNEMLKNSSFIFKQYLLIFLNRIIQDGKVPKLLNTGKCMLIFKVSSLSPTESSTN